jgi:hypothetical protein
MGWKQKTFVSMFVLSALVLVVSRCMTKENPPDPRGELYAGASTCRSCHRNIYDQYVATSHFQTTRPATAENIHGSFAEGRNRFTYSATQFVKMEGRDSGLFQAAYNNGKKEEEHRMDILFGRKHAQTFVYWKGDHTYELPVSYYHASGGWGTSPGYPGTTPDFNRVITSKCYECHASFVGNTVRMTPNGIEEDLDKNSMIFGIDCERCHGPAINHVNFHTAYPDEKQSRYMTKVSALARQPRLDVCAVCHSGNDKQKERATFGFKPGDTLMNYYTLWQPGNRNAEPDVHGNQYGLLAQSACFKKSVTMDCSTCHNPHQDAAAGLAVYSAACQTCHKSAHPAVSGQTPVTLQQNCIDCHMPLQASRAIKFQTSGAADVSPYKLRTHRIAVY